MVMVLGNCLREVHPDLAEEGEYLFWILTWQIFVQMIANNMTYLSVRWVCVNGRPLAGGGLILHKHQPVIAST